MPFVKDRMVRIKDQKKKPLHHERYVLYVFEPAKSGWNLMETTNKSHRNLNHYQPTFWIVVAQMIEGILETSIMTPKKNARKSQSNFIAISLHFNDRHLKRRRHILAKFAKGKQTKQQPWDQEIGLTISPGSLANSINKYPANPAKLSIIEPCKSTSFTSLHHQPPDPPNTTPSSSQSIHPFSSAPTGLVVGNQFFGGIVRQSSTFQSCNHSICGLGGAQGFWTILQGSNISHPGRKENHVHLKCL